MAIHLMDAMDSQTEKALLRETVQRRLPSHSWLFCEGDRTDDVYFVVSGLLKLMKTAADGAEAVLAIRGAGDVVGELSAIDARPRLVSAVTMIETSVLPISRDRFVEVMRERPDLALGLHRASFDVLAPGSIALADPGQFRTILDDFPTLAIGVYAMTRTRREYLEALAECEVSQSLGVSTRAMLEYPVHLSV